MSVQDLLLRGAGGAKRRMPERRALRGLSLLALIAGLLVVALALIEPAEAAPTLSVTPTGTVSIETGEERWLTLSLDSQPLSDVTVTLVSTDSGVVALALRYPGAEAFTFAAARVVVTFTKENWQQSQLVRLKGIGTGSAMVAREIVMGATPKYAVQQVDVTSDDCDAGLTTTCSLGTPTTAGLSISREITTASDVDWIKVKFALDKAYEVTLKGKDGTDTSQGTLFDPHLGSSCYRIAHLVIRRSSSGRYDRDELWHLSRDIGGTNNDQAIFYEHRWPSGGTCFFAVTGNPTGGDSGLGTYTLAVKEVALSSIADDCTAGTDTTCTVPADGTQQGGMIERNGDEDWFAVQLEAGKNYSVTRQSRYGWDFARSESVISGLYDGEGNLVKAGGDHEGHSWVDVAVSATGEYFVAVKQRYRYHLERRRVGPYALVVNELPADDINGDSSTTSMLAVGGSVSGTIGTSDDLDWHRVSLNANTEYVFDIDPQDAVGKRDPCDPNSPEGEIYTTDGTTHCLLGVPLMTNVRFYGLLDADGDTLVVGDQYRNPGPAVCEVTKTGDGTLVTCSRHASGSQEPDNYNRIRYMPKTAGTYYIVTAGLGRYTVSLDTAANVVVDDHPHDNSGTAIDLTGVTPGGAAQWISGKTDYVKDKDWIRVKLSAGREYKFSLYPDNDNYHIEGVYFGKGGSHWWTGYVAYRTSYATEDGETTRTNQTNYCILAWWSEPDPGVKARVRNSFTWGDDHKYCKVVVPSTGEYTLRIERADFRLGSYRFKVTAANGPQDDHPADSTTTAQATVGSSFRGQIDYENDFDWVKVSLQAGKSYLVGAVIPNAGDSDDPELAVGRNAVDSGGAELAGTLLIPGHNYDVCFTVTTSGDYFVQVGGVILSRGRISDIGPYDLTITERANCER